MVAAAADRVGSVREPWVHYCQHERNVVGAIRQTGGMKRLLHQWRQNRFRITGKGYVAYRELADSLEARLSLHALPPIKLSSKSWHFSRLAWQSWHNHYGAEGTAVRLAALALLAGDIF